MAKKSIDKNKHPKRNMVKLIVSTKSPLTGVYTFKEEIIEAGDLNDSLARHENRVPK